MVKINGLFVPVTYANQVQATAATIATFNAGISAAATPAPVTAPANAPTAPSRNRTHYMFMCVAAGLSNSQAVAAVQARYGANVPTNAASISWCRQANKQLAAGKTTTQANVARRMQS